MPGFWRNNQPERHPGDSAVHSSLWGTLLNGRVTLVRFFLPDGNAGLEDIKKPTKAILVIKGLWSALLFSGFFATG